MKCIFNVYFWSTLMYISRWNNKHHIIGPYLENSIELYISVALKLTSSVVFIFLIWTNTPLVWGLVLSAWCMAASVRRKFLPFGPWCDSSLVSHKSGSLLPDGVISSETQCSPASVGNIKWHSHPSDGLAPSEMLLSRLEQDRWCLTS